LDLDTHGDTMPESCIIGRYFITISPTNL